MNRQQIGREIEIQYERDLANLLATIIRKEFEIEKLRSLLCENDKFEVTEAFRSLDSHGHGYLTSNDLKLFLSFINIILPKQDDDLKEQCLSRRKFRPSTQKPQLAFYLEEQLSKIFELEISYIRETEAQKMDIMNNYGWNYRESFKRIARVGQNFIDKEAFNKDDNDLITMDEFCHAIFPSDFLSDNRNANEKIESPYFRYVKGDEQQFIEYVTGTNRAYEDGDKFDQDDFVFQNDIDNYNAQQKRQGVEQPKKFLKTSVQYDNTSNVRPFTSIENINSKDDYPTLNKYLMKLGKHENFPNPKHHKNASSLTGQKFLSPQQQPFKQYNHGVDPEGHFYSQRDFQYSSKSPINYLSSQKKLYMTYDNFNNQNDYQTHPDDYSQQYKKANPKNQYRPEQEQFQTFNENQSALANSFVVKSQLNPEKSIRNSLPPAFTKPVGMNASTQKFDGQPNYRSQYVGERIQPFRPQDFTKSRYEY